jgi:predicted transposase/invertase (TIGR01784 family)
MKAYEFLKEPKFILKEKTELAKFGSIERDKYETSLKNYRDLKSVIDTAFNDGKLEGLIEGKLEGLLEGKEAGLKEARIESARQLKALGVSIEIIMKSTNLSKEEIENL